MCGQVTELTSDGLSPVRGEEVAEADLAAPEGRVETHEGSLHKAD